MTSASPAAMPPHAPGPPALREEREVCSLCTEPPLLTICAAARLAHAGDGSARDGTGGLHHAKQWRLDPVRQTPELTACNTGDHPLAAIALSHVQCQWSKSNAATRDIGRNSGAHSAAQRGQAYFA